MTEICITPKPKFEIDQEVWILVEKNESFSVYYVYLNHQHFSPWLYLEKHRISHIIVDTDKYKCSIFYRVPYGSLSPIEESELFLSKEEALTALKQKMKEASEIYENKILVELKERKDTLERHIEKQEQVE